METFKEYDVEKCKRYHYTSSTSVYYSLYDFIDAFLKQGKKCSKRTKYKFNIYLTCMQTISYTLSLLIIKLIVTNSLNLLNIIMLIASTALLILISFIQSISSPKFNDLDTTLIALKRNLRSFIWILGFTKFGEYKTWRETSVSNKLFKLIIEQIKYSCVLSRQFNRQLHEWIDQCFICKYDLTPLEASEKLNYIMSLNDPNDELIRILQLVMITEINDIAITFDKTDNLISEELQTRANKCKEIWKKSLQLLLVHKKLFTNKIGPNKIFVNELISTVSNGLYEIEDKFAPIMEKRFTTKSYREHIIHSKTNFGDSLTAF